MLRGCLGLLVLLGVGEGLAFAQSAPPALLPDATALGDTPGAPAAPDGSGATDQRTEGDGTAKADTTEKADRTDGAGKQPAAADGQKTGQQQDCQTNQQPPPQLSPEEQARLELGRTHRGPCERIFVRGGYLMWWMQDAPASGALVTTGPVGAGGVLGQPGTQALYGESPFNFGMHPGIWVDGGIWLGECRQWGVGLGGFILERQGLGAAFVSDAAGAPLLARPFQNAITNLPSSLTIAAPGVASGAIAVTTDTRFAGGEANLLRNLAHTSYFDVRVLAGFRYLDLTDNLQVLTNSTLLADVPPQLTPNAPTRFPTGTSISIADRFTTRNQLYLGQVGGQIEWGRGPFYVSLQGKVGLGPNHQRSRILGSTTVVTPDQTVTTTPGGLLAVPRTTALPGGNFGRHTTNWFVIVPEVGIDIGVDVTRNLRLAVGYNFLYVNSVVRPGSQVNNVVNPNLVPSSLSFGSPSGPGQPTVLTGQDDFWVHGVRFMLELRF